MRLLIPVSLPLQVIAVEKADPANKGVSISTKGKRAFRFTEIKDFEHLVAKLRIRSGTTSSPHHTASMEVTAQLTLILKSEKVDLICINWAQFQLKCFFGTLTASAGRNSGRFWERALHSNGAVWCWARLHSMPHLLYSLCWMHNKGEVISICQSLSAHSKRMTYPIIQTRVVLQGSNAWHTSGLNKNVSWVLLWTHRLFTHTNKCAFHGDFAFIGEGEEERERIFPPGKVFWFEIKFGIGEQ